MLSASNVEWIQFINCESRDNIVDSIVDYMNQISLKSLKVFECSGFDGEETMQTVNKILEMVMDKVKKRSFYVMARFEVYLI